MFCCGVDWVWNPQLISNQCVSWADCDSDTTICRSCSEFSASCSKSTATYLIHRSSSHPRHNTTFSIPSANKQDLSSNQQVLVSYCNQASWLSSCSSNSSSSTKNTKSSSECSSVATGKLSRQAGWASQAGKRFSVSCLYTFSFHVNYFNKVEAVTIFPWF